MRRKEVIEVIGVDCPTCVYAIQKRLASLSGNVKFESDIVGNAVVEYDDDDIKLSEIYYTIRDAGYDLVKEELEVFVKEVSPEVSAVIEKRIKEFPGVLDAKIDSLMERVLVIYNPHTTSRRDILVALKSMGLELEESRKEHRSKFGIPTIVLRFSAFVSGVAALLISMSHVFPSKVSFYALLALSSLTIFLSYDIIYRGIKALFFKAPTMESLIALSACITFISGVFFTFMSSITSNASSFFEASAGVLGFVSLGKYIENALRKSALEYVNKLESSLHSKVKVIKENGTEDVSADLVSVNSVIEVKAGEKILVDGIVVDGWGYVDESTFTGEALPVFKTSANRDRVLAGTVLTSGYIKVRVTRRGKDTALFNLLTSAKEAVLHKPEFQQLADRIVGKLTWVVIATAIATASIWYICSHQILLSLLFAASVLAVSCPCPLGIAIPMVVSIGVIKASRGGILIRRGEVFEKMLFSTVLLMDKTGTVTIGKPSLKNIVTLIDNDEECVMKYACSLEQRSEHPLARAILDYCKASGISFEEPESFEHIPGLGVVGIVKGRKVAVGSINLAKGLELKIDDRVSSIIEGIGRIGGTPVIIMLDDRIAAVLEIRDEVREDVLDVVKYFKSVGFKIGIASGDIEQSVKYVKETLGLDFSYHGLRPEDKGKIIQDLQNSGHKILYVGDGVNDAIGLSTAFVGIAVGNAADIAKEAGDAILLKDSLRPIIYLHLLSKRVLRKAKENLFWAFAYNAILIPIAAGILYPFKGIMLMPEMAALAMVLSDITVVLNSLSLLRTKFSEFKAK